MDHPQAATDYAHGNGAGTPDPPRGPWSGFWSGLVCFVAGFIIIVVAQLAAVLVVAALAFDPPGAEQNDAITLEIAYQGDTLALGFLFSLPVIIAMLAFVVKVRHGQPFFDYLGLRPIEGMVLARWLLYAVVFFTAVYVSDLVFQRPLIPEWMQTAYVTANYPWLFFIGVAVFGPISEELLYRGYIIKVWAASAVGPVPGTVLLSLLWAAIHMQYDLYDMFWIVLMGVILCVSRLRTDSIVPALIVHMSWNTAGIVLLLLYTSA